MQGGSHFSYNAVNFHPEVRIYWKTLSLARRQLLFLHCSKLPSWSENLLKNLTTRKALVTFLTLQQTSIQKWESIKKLYHSQGAGHFSYIVANFHPEVRIYWKKHYHLQGGSHFSDTAIIFFEHVKKKI